MKRLFLCTMFVALTGLVSTLLTGLSPDTAHSAAPDYDAKTIAKELKQHSNQWAQAFTNKDLSFLKRIWSADFAYIMPDGTVYNKQSLPRSIPDHRGYQHANHRGHYHLQRARVRC